MEILIGAVAIFLMMGVIGLAVSAYRVTARVCPSCGTPGAAEDTAADGTFELRPGEWRLFGILAPKRVNGYWCEKCGHKFRVLKKLS